MDVRITLKSNTKQNELAHLSYWKGLLLKSQG
jgi:hypothetical protein